MRIFVILPAAGIGTRMSTGAANPAAPKQFLAIAGTPVLIHTLRAFAAVPRVTEILIAVRDSELQRVQTQISEFPVSKKIRAIVGGDSRQQSVANALASIQPAADDIILVHDAVRPLIAPATIDRTIDAILKTGAAIVALPAVDTIKQVERTADGAIISSTIPRERVVLAQTPQGALAHLLQRAFAEATTDDFLGTDEASLLERAGIPVAVVPGSPSNFKVTQPGDLELAEFYLNQRT